VPILPFGLVNAHLIIAPGGCVLVDAGLPGTERRLHAVLQRHGLDFKAIRLIVITHAHVDHAGNAARLQALTGAPIVAHTGDLPYYQRERAMSYCTTGWFGRLFLRTGLMHEPYAAFTPDILMRDHERLDLRDWGIDGQVVHTPGHTAGSLSVQLADEQVLVGDLLASGLLLGGIAFTGVPKRPPFEDDPLGVAQALGGLIESGGRSFYMGHGGPLTQRQVERHVRQLQSLRR
jgi:glyoxylase-like metal-dependent hydrolase (beta-lactamase superfamily II)